MSRQELVRAWKDPVYRAGLSREALARFPSHPSGDVELTDQDLKSASGILAAPVTTSPACSMYTWVHNHGCCPH